MKQAFSLFLILTLLAPPALFAQQEATQLSKDASKDFNTGLRVAIQAIQELGIVEDADKVKRVNEIGYRVARRAAPDMPYFSFRIVKMEEPNAFALPGGFIFITTGMLDLDLTDDQLAALLGHEIIHVKNNHIGKMGKRQTLMNLLYQALIIGIAFGIKEGESGYDPLTGLRTRSAKSEILQGSAAFGLVFQELLLRGFNRDLELESDYEGMIAAAGAGYSAAGTSGLFDKMRRKIYEAPGYGYWRTHPYLEDRVGIARTHAASIETSKNPDNPTDYRKRTQQLFLSEVERQKEEPSKRELRRMALAAYPHGDTSYDLRWWFIRETETEEIKKEPFYRDYGKIIRLYETNIEELEDEKKESDFLKKLRTNLNKVRAENETARPLYEEVLKRQMFDTDMLQRYISNYPESERLPEVRFRLAENYRILKKGSESADLYLEVMKTENPWHEKSRESLRRLISGLDDLTACYKIATHADDEELEQLAGNRMKQLAPAFDTLQNGYEFRRSYPGTPYDKTIADRMTHIASQRLNQGRLYQAIGEYQKALDQYNQILRYCSDLPIADEVKNTITDFQEVTSAKTQF